MPVALAFARACSAGPSPVWRIASVTRPSRSRGYLTERGLTAGRHHYGCVLGHVGSQSGPGPMGASSSLTGQWPQPASGLNRPVACSLSAGNAAARYATAYRPSDSDATGPGAGRIRTRIDHGL